MLTVRRSELLADQLKASFDIEVERLNQFGATVQAQLVARRARLAQDQNAYDRFREQVEALAVRAGLAGVVQQVMIEEGEQVQPGANVARVARPDELQAELRVPETQARDVVIGQLVRRRYAQRHRRRQGDRASTRPSSSGTVQVDVELTGKLPRGARPDQSVDGTIEIERLANAVHTGRPAYGQPNSTIKLFKVIEEGEYAVQVPVELGRTSVNAVEIVQGLGARRRSDPLRHLRLGRQRPHPIELTMLANLLNDIRYSLHGFALRPMFAAVVVLTLALGIGVNVAVFSLFDRIMLRELNVAESARAREARVTGGRRPRQSNQERTGARRRDVQLPDVPRPRAEAGRLDGRLWGADRACCGIAHRQRGRIILVRFGADRSRRLDCSRDRVDGRGLRRAAIGPRAERRASTPSLPCAPSNRQGASSI